MRSKYIKKRPDIRRRIAHWSESLAVKYLKRRGLIIWKRNIRCSKGEIDILALSPRTLHIIEVKARRHGNRGFGLAESVSDTQLKRISRATAWLMRKESFALKRMAIRHISFDFVGIEYKKGKLFPFKKIYLNYSPGSLGQAMLLNDRADEL